MTAPSLIDTHAHLTFPDLRDDVDGVLARAAAAGVTRIITIGTELTGAAGAIELATQHADTISAAVGFHPHEADNVSTADVEAMAQLWDDPRVVAAGEMGLDYHYDLADREKQRTVFSQQLQLAVGRSLPLIIHCREAIDDAVPMLIEHGFEGRKVVFHCFTGTGPEADRLAQHGWRISFTGVVTFKRSTELQEIARDYPSEQLMVETDSPYLSPVPVRSKRPNEPAHVAHTAAFIAQLRGESLEELAEQSTRNAREFFGL